MNAAQCDTLNNDAVKIQLHEDTGGGTLASLEPRLPAIQRAYTAEPSAASMPSGDCIVTKAGWQACICTSTARHKAPAVSSMLKHML
jgi:hypothetical protein